MKTQQRTSTEAMGIGRRLAMAIGTGVCASTILAFSAGAASAFDIGGLIGTAMAIQMGAYHGAPSYYRPHARVAAHSGDSDSSGVERDARDVDPPDHAVRSETKMVAHQQSPGGFTAQASERDASADEPAYRPSR
jgi:hypothetical protein